MSTLTKIAFKNFRVFRSKTEFELLPITFLTGPNSSGKSSILKALLLLKSNYSSSLQVLDFSGAKHNLGTFDNTLNKDASTYNEELVFWLQTNLGSNEKNNFLLSTFFKQSITTKRSIYSILNEYDDSAKSPITIELAYVMNDRSGKLKRIELYSKDDAQPFLKLDIGQETEDSNHVLYIDSDKILKEKSLSSMFYDMLKARGIEPNTKKLAPKTYKHRTIFSPKENTKEIYIDEPITVFEHLFKKHLFERFDVKNRKDIHPYFLSIPIRRILRDFSEITDNVEYLEAVRANTKRIYTNDSQGTSFNELILEYRSREISQESLRFTNKWLKLFEIADELKFENVEGVATTIFLVRKNKPIALADLGYGITQFLPILLKIALEVPMKPRDANHLAVVKKIILLEEPETNLHPKLQSLIADFLLDAIRTFEISFIVETHSEYIIRKMQLLSAEKKIKPKDVAIYYFSPNTEDSDSTAKRINIQPNGSLSEEFGEGFFDEATNLKLKLLSSKLAK